MAIGLTASGLLHEEAHALLSRLGRLRSFALQMPMVPAANIPIPARTAIECQLAQGREELGRRVRGFIAWLRGRDGRAAGAEEAQRRFSFLRLRFNAVLTQLDIFADVLTQRSEHELGVWVAGLDALAEDALALPDYYEAPPVICYLDRGHGAAIRRARTRLPGGDENPVAIIRVPRERMVGSGIASSLIHEVGHQGVSLLGLAASLRPLLARRQAQGGPAAIAWQLWGRWINEILADFWSVAKVGLTSTLGLIGVVSLPRAFVFRVELDDPHPIPWMRVLLSCAIGRALYPHPQWQELAAVWRKFYPPEENDPAARDLLRTLERAMPAFVELLIGHRPASLRGASVGDVLRSPEVFPERLLAQFERWRAAPGEMHAAAPTRVFAVIGQARADGRLLPGAESSILRDLLARWAVQRSSQPCAWAADAARAATHSELLMSRTRFGLNLRQGVPI